MAWRSAARSIRDAPLRAARKVQLRRQEDRVPKRVRGEGKGPHIFNIDLHISVIRDFALSLSPSQAELVTWSISGHNHLIPGRIPISDPVDVLNAQTWRNMSPELAVRFRERYSAFLNSFDGFVVTHTPSFVQLFATLGKPIFVVASTRYEAPYTFDSNLWAGLNETMEQLSEQGLLHLTANNAADRDYVRHFAGLKPTYFPSLGQTRNAWNGESGGSLILSRSRDIAERIQRQTGGRYRDVRTLGRRYPVGATYSAAEVLMLPQNVSTMTLFELATAGVPVAIPSRRWMRDLFEQGQVLAELTYPQIYQQRVTHDCGSCPNAWWEPHYLDWWIDRADFADRGLMPNVRLVDSPEELMDSRRSREELEILSRDTASRNVRLVDTRSRVIDDWLKKL